MPTKEKRKREQNREKWLKWTNNKNEKQKSATSVKNSVLITEENMPFHMRSDVSKEITSAEGKNIVEEGQLVKTRYANYYSSHKQQILDKRKQYRTTHADLLKSSHEKYNATNREIIRLKQKQYNASHIQEIRSKLKLYNELNRDHIRFKQKQYDDFHKKKIRQKQINYNISHKKKIKSKQVEYNAVHRENIRLKQAQYNAVHRENIQFKQAEYDAVHRENIQLKQAEYDAVHKENIRLKQVEYDAVHRENIRVKQAKYDAVHRKHIQLKQAKYDALHRKNIQLKQVAYDAMHKMRKRKAEAESSKYIRKKARTKNRYIRRNKSHNIPNRKTEYARKNAILNCLRIKLQIKNAIDRLIEFTDNESVKTANQITMKKLQLQSLVQKAYRLREIAINRFFHDCKDFQHDISKAVVALSNLEEELTEDSFLSCISGSKTHTPNSECFFYETSYKSLPLNSFTLIVDIFGVIWNMPKKGGYIMHKKKHTPVEWACFKTCIVRLETVRKISQFLLQINSLRDRQLLDFFGHLDICNNKYRRNDKLGHPVSCLDSTCDCNNIIRLLNEAKCHFSKLRMITTEIYILKGLAEAIVKLTDSINKSTDETDITDSLRQLMKRLRYDDEDSFQEITTTNTVCNINESEMFQTYTKQLTAISKEINDFADTPCACCERLCKSSYLTPITSDFHKKCFENSSWLQLRAYLILKYNSDADDFLHVCNYCRQKLNNDTIPCRSALNALEVDEMPLELRSLNTFEQILIQKVKAFQTVIRLGPVKAKLPMSELVKGIKGRIVYLPLPLQENINALPSAVMPNHEVHILVNGLPTKNKIIWQDIVRVEKVYAALEKLRKINPLYKNVKMSFNEVEEYIYSSHTNVCDNLEIASPIIEKLQNKDVLSIYQHYSIHPISSKHYSSDLEHYRMKEVKAPAMNLWDESLDLLCFPQLFPFGRFGKLHNRPVSLSESEYRVSRLLHKDSRFRLNPQYLFHLFYDSEIKSLRNSISFMLRTTKTTNCSVQQMLEKVENKDYDLENSLTSFFAIMRGTKEYWNRRHTELLCMMRDFGPPVWFVTLSCAEYNWSDLYEHLKKINADVPNIDKMTPGALCALDPVSVVRHYQSRFHSIFNHLILDKSNPVLGIVSHYFWRVEYQSRSAPHIHMLLWCSDAPIVGKASKDDIGEYIQKYVTCSIPNENVSPQLHELVMKYQSHKCSAYCLRKKKYGGNFVTKCKFGFPRPQRHLFCLNDVYSSVRHRQKGKTGKRLYELPRTFQETYINDYNPILLFSLKANVDVQYIGDESAAIARYVTAYISKQEKTEMDEVWNDICHESLRSKLWSLGLKALTHRECGSYEIADRLLGTRLYGKSDVVLFINTNYPEKRNRMLKPYSNLVLLKDMDPTCTDLYMPNLINDLYPNRPDELENMGLYEFAKWYSRSSSTKSLQTTVLKNNMGYINRRSKPFVINHYIHHPEESEQEKENYCHQMLLLFFPWRNENELLGNYQNFSEAFDHVVHETEAMLIYHLKLKKETEMQKKNNEELEKNTPKLHSDDDPKLNDIMDAIHPKSARNLDNNIRSLNEDQLRIFNKITTKIKHQQQHLNKSCTCSGELQQTLLFASGVGGCGKSYLINTIKQWMHENIDCENKISVAVCAPTGLAALNVGGITIHRLLMLPVEHGKTADYKSLTPHTKQLLRKVLGGLKLLIIDEVSMISSLMLTYVHLRLAEIMEIDQLFGKTNVVLFGDLLQLRPVKGNPLYRPLTSQEIRLRLHSVGAVDLWCRFEYDELTKNVRQSSDLRYASLLSNVRTGIVSEADVALLQTKIISVDTPDPLQSAIQCYKTLTENNLSPVCLFATNLTCRLMSEIMLNDLGCQIISIKSIDTLNGPVNGKKAYQVAMEKLDQIKDNLSLTAGLETEIKVSVTARIMLRRNIDLTKGLVNGAVGKIVNFEFTENIVSKIQLLLDNATDPIWINRANVKFQLLKDIYVYRRQFPISLAYAITVHKSQGLSLHCAIIDIGKNIFSEGMTYVALSRVTSLQGLHLISFDKTKVFADKHAIQVYNELRRKFQPQLGLLPIGVTKKRPSIMPFKPSNMTVSDSNVPRVANNLVLKGFTNPDGVSCYANAALQSLLSLSDFILLIEETNSATDIISALKDVIYAKGKMDKTFLLSLGVRNAVGRIFIQQQQQDAMEFISQLFNQLQTAPNYLQISQLFSHEVAYRKRCLNCQLETNIGQPVSSTNFFILNFSCQMQRKVSWEALLEWKSDSMKCHICSHSMESKSFLTDCEKYLFVLISRFDNNQNKIHTLISDFHNKHVNIDGILFETVAAILHQGHSISSGHYTCIIKTSGSWKHCNDTIISERKMFIRDLKDVYILLLNKI